MSDEVKAEGSQEPPKPSTPQAGQTAPDTAPQVGKVLDADVANRCLRQAEGLVG